MRKSKNKHPLLLRGNQNGLSWQIDWYIYNDIMRKGQRFVEHPIHEGENIAIVAHQKELMRSLIDKMTKKQLQSAPRLSLTYTECMSFYILFTYRISLDYEMPDLMIRQMLEDIKRSVFPRAKSNFLYGNFPL